MHVAVFGLGYVGCVSAACLSSAGHQVLGVDVSAAKVDMINRGVSPIQEPGLEAMIAAATTSGSLRATTSAAEAVQTCDLSLICVGTPSRENGSLNTEYLLGVAREIGTALRRSKHPYHVVALRSTSLPGTVDRIGEIVAEHSGRVLGQGFGVASNPEFLREGSAIADYRQPPFTLIGTDDERAVATLKELYAALSAPVLVRETRVSEMLKYACNAFHAVKVTFANEIGHLCKDFAIDSHAVMQVLVEDRKLNISPAYLMPGFAFGGSCLPKDVSALAAAATERNLAVPMLKGVLASNAWQIESALRRIIGRKKRRIALLGLSFKPGTDDLRYSPAVTLAESLIGKGFEVAVHDPDIDLERLLGANREYIEQEIPHLARILHPSPSAMVDAADILVIAKRTDAFASLARAARPGQLVIDLVRALPGPDATAAEYDGLCW